ncbi:MAG: peptidoglycan DD-metalloendopeptidase family protein [Peptococcaceae bacterium]|nr:peptidoglycan DD-metalloendopeptidase family protein [Peptococcaceae bacterium]
MSRFTKLKITVMTLLFVVAFVFPVAADELNEAIRKQQELIEQQNRAASRLNNLTSSADTMKKQIQQLTTQISTAELDLRKKEQAYAEAQQAVVTIKKEVNAKQIELNDRQDVLRQRVRTIYEEGQMSYLEVIFQATDLADFISRVEYMSCLVENDRNILNDIRVQKQELDKKKEELEAKLEHAEKLKREAEQAKSHLDNIKAKKEVALAQNEQDQAALLEQIEKLEKDSKELEAKIRELQAKNAGTNINGSISVWPTPGCKYITSPFGYRIHPITRQHKLHTGVDIGAPHGSNIVAAGSGIVIFSGWYGAYGNAVIIDHGNGLSSLYGHMSSRSVAVNAKVAPGQSIGKVGSTGWSTGPHLHFEIRKNGEPVNPMGYF